MQIVRTHYWSAAIAIVAIAFIIVPSPASSQGIEQATFQVLVNGTPVGNASAATNLPADAVEIRQDSTSSLPHNQVESSQQGSVVLTSADPALVATIQSWMKTDNSGYKNTVQRKTVEIDRLVGSGATTRFRLSGAWPTRIGGTPSDNTITMVYQRLAIVH
ncbi:MAG: hypothetical protein ABI035_14065 [Gemmatimonadaceae bacterium]